MEQAVNCSSRYCDYCVANLLELTASEPTRAALVSAKVRGVKE